jgi:hypothetical protein
VGLVGSVSCFHCRDQQAVPWCTGRRIGGCEGAGSVCGHRSGEPGLVWGRCLWKAGCRSDEANGVRATGFQVWGGFCLALGSAATERILRVIVKWAPLRSKRRLSETPTR